MYYTRAFLIDIESNVGEADWSDRELAAEAESAFEHGYAENHLREGEDYRLAALVLSTGRLVSLAGEGADPDDAARRSLAGWIENFPRPRRLSAALKAASYLAAAHFYFDEYPHPVMGPEDLARFERVKPRALAARMHREIPRLIAEAYAALARRGPEEDIFLSPHLSAPDGGPVTIAHLSRQELARRYEHFRSAAVAPFSAQMDYHGAYPCFDLTGSDEEWSLPGILFADITW